MGQLNDYIPDYKKNKTLPDIYQQSYTWYRQGAGWILREEWYLVEKGATSLQQELLAFRETFYDRRYAE